MSDTFTQESWAHDLLTRMGYPTTQNNMTSILAWEYAEGGHFKNAAHFNPLNTTLDHDTYGSINTHNVAPYPDYETGMSKTIATLNDPRYTTIRHDLQTSADPATTFSDVTHSKWGTGWGGSPQPLFDRAHRDLAQHPGDVTSTATPAAASPAAPTASSPPAAVPDATPTATPSTAMAAPIAATTPTTAQTGFQGADVDGLDKLAQEFTTAAQVCNEVKAACEVIVAAASMFGPFAAAFIAYLKGTVIPWLTKIAEALQAMAKVLSVHSQAQKDASSTATSLPSYVSAGTTPPAAAPEATPPSVATHTSSYLGGLIKIGTDNAGHVVSVGLGGQSEYYGTQTDYHINRDAAGNISQVTSHYEERIGTAANPLVHTSGDTLDAVVRDKNGDAIGLHSTYTEGTQIAGTDALRENGDLTVVAPNATDMHVDGSAGLVLGPGTGDGTHPVGSLPGGARMPELPGGDGSIHATYKPPEISLGGSMSSGAYGNSIGASAYGRLIGGEIGGSGSDGALTVGGAGKGEVGAGGGFFLGTSHWNHETTSGGFGAANIGAELGAEGGARIGTEHTWAQGIGGFGVGPEPDLDVSAYAIQHGPDAAPVYDLGGKGKISDFGVGGQVHHDTTP